MRELWSYTDWPWQFVGLRDVIDIIIVAILILNAGIFPNTDVDQTLNPQVLFGPRPAVAPTTWSGAKDAFNFGTLEVDRSGRLTAAYVNTAGQTLYSLTLAPR